MLRQINSVLRIVFNQTYVTNTDALYKISFLDGINGKQVAVVFINHLPLFNVRLQEERRVSRHDN